MTRAEIARVQTERPALRSQQLCRRASCYPDEQYGAWLLLLLRCCCCCRWLLPLRVLAFGWQQPEHALLT